MSAGAPVTWHVRAERLTRTYAFAEAVPSIALKEPAHLLHPLKRETDALVAELARVETAYEQTARGLAAYATVTAYLQATHASLSATSERGFCVLEQDGTTQHCAATILDLAHWCRTQSGSPTTQPVGGFVDRMARQ